MFLTAREAAAELGVSTATLYAYVSRGLLRSRESPEDPRMRRYFREDVEALKRRKEARQHPEVSAEQALNWGEPVLESAISLIEGGRLFYRGRDAVALAETESLEDIASWIWLGRVDRELFGAAARKEAGSRFDRVAASVPRAGATSLTFQLLLPLLAGEDLTAFDSRPESVAATGVRILTSLFAAVAAGQPDLPAAQSLPDLLRAAWSVDEPAAVLIRQALILCADHELNVSTFTARCVASAGGSPYDVVLAALAALRGVHHGGQTERAEAFLRDLRERPAPEQRLAHMLRWGEPIPGFGHPLYPDGDPRATAILAGIDRLPSDRKAFPLSICQEVVRLTGQKANLDFALGALATALDLPAGSGLTIFALGRTVGWIGHAIEQYGSGRLIRPRARYTGVRPPTDG